MGGTRVKRYFTETSDCDKLYVNDIELLGRVRGWQCLVLQRIECFVGKNRVIYLKCCALLVLYLNQPFIHVVCVCGFTAKKAPLRASFKLSNVIVNAKSVLQALSELEPLAVALPADPKERAK